jgi:predicted Zn finger-like uncharacterized protein
MPIHAICPACRAEYNLPDQQAGKKVRCKQCQGTFKVLPVPPDEPADVIEAEVAEVVEEVEAVEEVEVAEAPRRQAIRGDAPEKPSRRGSSGPRARDEEYQAKLLRGLDAPPRREPEPRRETEELPDRPAKNKTLLLIGAAVAGIVVLLGGGVVTALLLLSNDSADTKVAANVSPTDPVKPVVKPPEIKPPEIKPPENKPPEIKPPENKLPDIKPPVESTSLRPPADLRPAPGRRDLSEDKATIDKVKRATVYVEVLDAHGRSLAGTGFFGVPEARNLLLTTAHVVGMLAPDSHNPKRVGVFLNSGQPDEKEVTARVLGVDRAADLAVLDVGNAEGMPEPLRVSSSEALTELQKLWVFGFPLGKRLGKEITIRDTSVSAFRRKSGVMDKIQVNGGMDPGNSGGPVVDANGQVVGVSISGIPGRQINFAIPGEHVQGILNGRVSSLGLGMPFFAKGDKVGIPVTIDMLDPRHQVKQVALEVWTGDARTASRPSAKGATPAPLPGDSPHQKVPLTYENRVAKGEVLLPDLPAGKTYWLQPTWVNGGGENQWDAATQYKLNPATPPLERKPIGLVLRYPRGLAHPLTLKSDVSFRVGTDDDTEAARMETTVTFRENVVNVSAGGAATIDLHYLRADRFLSLGKGDKRPSRLLQEIQRDKNLFNALHVTLQVDAHGNASPGTLDKTKLRPFNAELVKLVEDFHAPVAAALNALSVTMPNKKTGETTAPGESWKAPPRPLPLETPGKSETGSVEITYTYLGQRSRDKHTEAVIAIDGVARGGKAKEAIGGRASGLAVLNLSTGQISTVETKVVVDMDAALSEADETTQTMRVLATFDFRLRRD